MFASFFGSPEPPKEERDEVEEAARKAARRKAAAEARKRREAEEGQGREHTASSRSRERKKAAPAGAASLGAIHEDGVNLSGVPRPAAEDRPVSVVPQTAAELANFAARAAAAQEEAVADLMRQADQQHREELATAVHNAVEETEQRMRRIIEEEKEKDVRPQQPPLNTAQLSCDTGTSAIITIWERCSRKACWGMTAHVCAASCYEREGCNSQGCVGRDRAEA